MASFNEEKEIKKKCIFTVIRQLRGAAFICSLQLWKSKISRPTAYDSQLEFKADLKSIPELQNEKTYPG